MNEASGLDWTVVRGPRLTEKLGYGLYRVGWVGVAAMLPRGRARQAMSHAPRLALASAQEQPRTGRLVL